MHVKDNVGTYERLGVPQPPEDPLSLLDEWSYEPSHGEDLLALSSIDLDPSKYLASTPKKDTWLFGKAMEDLPVENLWLVDQHQIGQFVRRRPRRLSLLLDTHDGEMVLAAPIGDETLTLSMPFESEAFVGKIASVPLLKPMLEPMFRVMKESEQKALDDPELRAKLQSWARKVAGPESQEIERIVAERWDRAPRRQFRS